MDYRELGWSHQLPIPGREWWLIQCYMWKGEECDGLKAFCKAMLADETDEAKLVASRCG